MGCRKRSPLLADMVLSLLSFLGQKSKVKMFGFMLSQWVRKLFGKKPE